MSSRISWDDQRLFLAVIEEGSLAGAARRLGLSHPTVRNRVEALETALGSVLFTRSVHGLTPTDHAMALVAPARSMAAASDLFVRLAAAPPGEAAGVVRLSVAEFMGVEVVPPILARLRKTHPGITIELSLSNALADVLAQEVDIAIRSAEPTQAALVARKVPEIALGFFASPDYLDRRGRPQTTADLEHHDLIGPDRSRSDWAMAEALGLGRAARQFVLRSDSHPAHIAAARAGVGIAVVQVPVGERDARLERVLPDFTVAHLATWIVTHEDLRAVPRIRAVFDALVEAFAERPDQAGDEC